MKVLKFGGTSVGSAERIREVINIFKEVEESRIVILSAMAGTTDKLIELARCLRENQANKAMTICRYLQEKYRKEMVQLFTSPDYMLLGEQMLVRYFDKLRYLVNEPYSVQHEKIIVVQGELITTELVGLVCSESGIASQVLSAFDVIKTDQSGQPDLVHTAQALRKRIPLKHDLSLYLIPGYLCQNANGEVDNLGRGGSDYTATIIGAAVQANEVQIWTDVDGIQNMDPRYFSNTRSLAELSYWEATMLAVYGAKILHPACVIPLRDRAIPLRIKNVFSPSVAGTLVGKKHHQKLNCAVSVKDGMQLLVIEPNELVNLNELLLKIFELVQRYGLKADLLSVTNQTISIVLEEQLNITKLQTTLQACCGIVMESNYSIINIIGDFQKNTPVAVDHIFRLLGNIPVRVSTQKMDGNNYLLLLIATANKQEALELLNTHVLANPMLKPLEERA
jgi:aspartate kinase